LLCSLFLFRYHSTSDFYTLSLHDALPISRVENTLHDNRIDYWRNSLDTAASFLRINRYDLSDYRVCGCYSLDKIKSQKAAGRIDLPITGLFRHDECDIKSGNESGSGFKGYYPVL